MQFKKQTLNILHLVKCFVKELNKSEKRKGLLKILKNMENKGEEQLKKIENKENKQAGIDIFDRKVSQEAKKKRSLNLTIKKKVSTTKGLTLRAIN